MDLDEFVSRLELSANRVGPEVNRTVKQQGRLLRALIMERASGRPGPNVISGDYRSSWKPEPFDVPVGGGVTIGTREPQGRRLEYGFYDMTDSIGRHFFQVPRPHVDPAVNELSDGYVDAFKQACDRIFGGA